MNCFKGLGVFLVLATGLWGCSRGPGPASEAGRIKALEAKSARLEDDFKSASAARDLLRTRLGDAEQAQARLQKEIEKLRVLARERDEFQAQLKTRTHERDQLQTQYEGFRKNLRDLLGQAEAAQGRPNDLAGSDGPTLAPAPQNVSLPAATAAGTGPMPRATN